MGKVVEIVDSIMGSGKSTEIIKWIDANYHQRYIYVSPLLSEVESGGRLHQAVSNVEFHSPEDVGDGKSAAMLELLKAGANVSCTHSLYKLMTDEHFEAIAQHDYVVVVDEEIGLIEAFNDYSIEDLKWLIKEGFIKVGENDGMVVWVNQSVEVACPSHKYYRLRQMCNSGCLYTTKRSDTMLTVQLPSKLLESAKRVIILTYLFKGNILDSFLKLKGFESVPFSEPLALRSICGKKLRELLAIEQPPKNFKLRNKLTYSWYMNPMKGDLQVVKNAILRTCRNWGVPSENILYTFPKYRSSLSTAKGEKIKPTGYIVKPTGNPCWLAASTRATNNHAHVTHMIHAYNRHTNVAVASYLQDWDCPVKTDVFALSEMIQWLWRGCIRNGEVMHVCVFSSRMEKLLRDWLESLPEEN